MVFSFLFKPSHQHMAPTDATFLTERERETATVFISLALTHVGEASERDRIIALAPTTRMRDETRRETREAAIVLFPSYRLLL